MPGKKKKPQPESESEENSEKEESEEEQEEGSEEEDDEDKGSDEEEEEEESGEEKSEKSEESEGSEKSEKSSKSSKSSSSDGSKSSSDGSDSSGKKKKKKDKDKKDKKKGDQGKKDKKDKSAEEKKKTPLKEIPALDPPKLTIASVFEDLDELSCHLARTFSTFEAKEEVNSIREQPSPILKYPSPPASPGKELIQAKALVQQAASLPIFNHNYNPEKAKPLTEEAGVQYNAESNVRRHASPEAIRAVQEYKQRKELEKHRAESPEELGPQNNRPKTQNKSRDNPQSQFYSAGLPGPKIYEKQQREERKGEQDEIVDFRKRTVSPKKPSGSRFNQIAEDYYASLYKKSAKNPISGQKTIHDLYKYKPKPMFVEEESQPISHYNESEFNIPKSRPYETYDPRLKSQTQPINERYDPLKSNKKQISDAMEVLTRRGRNNPNF